MKEVLARHRGRINESAKTAGISTRQFSKLMKKYEADGKKVSKSKKTEKTKVKLLKASSGTK